MKLARRIRGGISPLPLSGVLGLPPFFGDDLDSLPDDSVSFRAMSKLPSGERHTALAVGRLGVELMAWIQQRFRLPEVDVPTC